MSEKRINRISQVVKGKIKKRGREAIMEIRIE
jgi:hypothetical protein